MKYILTIIIAAFVAATSAYCQTKAPGIYLTVKCAKQSEKYLVAINGKQVCLAPQPIVLSTEFTAITELQQAGEKVWFDLTLSGKAIHLLSQLSSSLPKSTFAFMIDGAVFTTFESKELKNSSAFRFQGTSKSRSMFTDAQKSLKAIVGSNTQ